MESSCLTFDSETSGQTSEDDGGSSYERIWAECSVLFEGRSDWKDEENEATEEEEGEGNGRIDFNGVILELPPNTTTFSSAISSSSPPFPLPTPTLKHFLEGDYKAYFEEGKIGIVVEVKEGGFKVVNVSSEFLSL
ncbi:hypothetical protein TL16_g08006, partial [Triparma laevis f. inornata]